MVVEFAGREGTTWVGNFELGYGRISGTWAHPNGTDAIVIAAGTAYSVSPSSRAVVEMAGYVEQVWPVEGPPGLLFQLMGIVFVRIGAAGELWRTRRVSWDGFADLELGSESIRGSAWEPGGTWVPFVVDLHTGAVHGGSFALPSAVAPGLLRRAWAWLTRA